MEVKDTIFVFSFFFFVLHLLTFCCIVSTLLRKCSCTISVSIFISANGKVTQLDVTHAHTSFTQGANNFCVNKATKH